MRSDWLLELQISFAIHLRAITAGFAPKNNVIVAGIKEFKNHLFVVTKLLFVNWQSVLIPNVDCFLMITKQSIRVWQNVKTIYNFHKV